MNAEENENVTFPATPNVLRMVAGSGTWQVRAYFSSSHLWAAKHFVQLAAELENSNGVGSGIDIQHRAYVINAVLSSVAFLEAAINELCKDVFDRHESYIAPISEEARVHISAMWENTEEKKRFEPILKKYQRVLSHCEKDQFNKNEQPYQNARLAIELRNGLMHYKPESYGGYQAEFQNFSDQHLLTQQLRSKFIENPLVLNSGNPYFPDKCLGSPCADWAIRSVKSLTDAFFLELGVKPHYQHAEL
ncbi:MAG: hypothetical protein RBJ76_01375 [Stenomitos frigidus ULC029]